MDRSFLLQKEVIEASREFVCIRLATYEDKEEADYLVRVFAGRSGALENTVFAILSPNGDRYLSAPGRSPRMVFADAREMAAEMRVLATGFKPKAMQRSLPAMKDFRLSLNVAACDNMPLVAAVADSPADQQKWNAKLAKLAWTGNLLGVCAYAPPSTTRQLRDAKITAATGLYLIAPDAYGQTGTVLTKLSAKDDTALAKELRTALKKFQPAAKYPGSHIGEGDRRGIRWETALPVTDPQAQQHPR